MDYGNNGYIGTWLCGDNGVFSVAPVINLDFTKSHAEVIPGITIVWSTAYNEWATSFRVTAYHVDMVAAILNGSAVSPRTILTGDLSGYDRIKIEVMAWSKPKRRARVESVYLGIEKVYDKEEIVNFSMSLFVDPLSASLPKSEITFELDNVEGKFNLDNLLGEGKYILERQEISVIIGYLVGGVREFIPGGTYYLSEWNAPQNGITATFTARDALEFMTDAYAGPYTGTLKDIAEAAFEQANLPPMEDGSNRWEVSSSLAAINAASVKDSVEHTIAEVLQLVANAGCCVFYQDRTGKIRIEKLHMQASDYKIDRFLMYKFSEIKLDKQLRAINVNNGQYELPVGRKGDTQSISNELISDIQAEAVAVWAADYLQNRRTLSGDYRPDPRLDPLDMVQNENKYSNSNLLITTVKYIWNGAFRGSYEGRGVDSASAYYYFAGDIFAGEV